MKLLVVEDLPQHLEDARAVVAKLVGCEVMFASTLFEAFELLQVNEYDGAICDVLFPQGTWEEEPKYYSWYNAFALSRLLEFRGVHHVFNTSGNHHGSRYDGFCNKTTNRVDVGGFMYSGMVIEAYPSNSDADLEADHKQWRAAFRYMLLVLSLRLLPRDEMMVLVEELQEGVRWAPYGDYGTLTERLDELDHPFALEVFSRFNI